MLVLWEQRLAILATPKTGSTAIEAALAPLAAVAIRRPPALKHTNYQYFQQFVRPYLESAAGAPFAVAAVMRDPCDWLGSWYRDRSRDEMVDSPNSTRHLSFDAFVQAWCASPRPTFADIGSQHDFLTAADGRTPEHLFTYETIEGFVAFLEEHLGFAIELPQLNVSPQGETLVGSETEALLQHSAKLDYALYQHISRQQHS